MRTATPAEVARIRANEQRIFGVRINYCESIPPRHTPHTMSDGHTYCTTCGEEITR